MLLSNPSRRREALKRLNLDRGEHLVAMISVQCGECDAVARRLKARAAEDGGPRVVILSNAPAGPTRAWAKKMRIGKGLRVVAADERTLNQIGVFYLPTVALVRDGEVAGVTDQL